MPGRRVESLPEVSTVQEAGRLMENLPALWEQADLTERRTILLTMLDAVYLDTESDQSIVALKPKPAFRELFHVATTREGSGVILFPENEEASEIFGSSQPDNECLWWRRGRVELHRNHYLSDFSSARDLVLVELLAA